MNTSKEVSCKIVWNPEQVVRHALGPALLTAVAGLVPLVLLSDQAMSSIPPNQRAFASFFAVSWSAFALYLSWQGARVPWRISVSESTVRFRGPLISRGILGNTIRGADHGSMRSLEGDVTIAVEYHDFRTVLDAIEERFPEVPPLRPF